MLTYGKVSATFNQKSESSQQSVASITVVKIMFAWAGAGSTQAGPLWSGLYFVGFPLPVSLIAQTRLRGSEQAAPLAVG